jgi:hypothetical protein
VLPGPPVSAPRHAAPLARASAHTPAAAIGPRYRRSRPSVARAPPPYPVTRQRRRPRPSVGGRCRPPKLSPTAPGAPSLFPVFPSMRRRTPDPLSLFPLCRASELPQKAPAAVLLPFHPTPSHPCSSTLPPPSSFPELASRPQTPGPSLLSPISYETSPPSAFTGETLATLLLAFLGPHLTFLPLSPWCRTRVVSSVTTMPAPPP